MSTKKVDFCKFSEWLTKKSEELSENSFVVELQRNDSARASIRLRAERSNRVGELTVWDDGMASQAVIDLEVGEFVYMRDGITLGDDWEFQLSGFFEETTKK